MANIYAVDYTKRFVTVPAKLTDVASQGGRLRVLYDTHVVVASDAQNDVLYLGRIPGGSKIWEASYSVSATIGSGSTVDLGWQAVSATATAANTDLDGIFDGVVTTGASTWFWSGGAGQTTAKKAESVVNTPISIPDEADIVATILGSDPAAGVIIKCMVMYSID